MDTKSIQITTFYLQNATSIHRHLKIWYNTCLIPWLVENLLSRNVSCILRNISSSSTTLRTFSSWSSEQKVSSSEQNDSIFVIDCVWLLIGNKLLNILIWLLSRVLFVSNVSSPVLVLTPNMVVSLNNGIELFYVFPEFVVENMTEIRNMQN